MPTSRSSINALRMAKKMATSARKETDKNPSTQRVLMWNVSSTLADTLFNWANVVLVIGAAMVLIGTIGSIQMGAVKEHFAEIRISDNERATKTAIAESDVAKAAGEAAKADAASANARALEAQVALEKFKADRTPDLRIFGPTLEPFAGIEWDASVVSDDLEADKLLAMIAIGLRRAKWVQVDWSGSVPARQIPGSTRPVGPLPTYFGGMFTRGTLVTIHPDFTTQPDSPQLKAARALVEALKGAGVDCAGLVGMETSANKNAVHMVIARK